MGKCGQNYIATYFGGSANESSWAITLDDAGNVYVTGYTASRDFPVKPDSYVSTAKGKGDVFVLKFDKELKTILASALIGGSEDEVGYSILYDRKSYIYIAGYPGSKDFPVTPSEYCTQYNGGEGDAYILKMDKDLKSLIEIKNGSGNTPLLSAVKRIENEAVIGCLLDYGADIAAVDSTGEGVIHVANNCNIKFLLRKGAYVNLQDR